MTFPPLCRSTILVAFSLALAACGSKEEPAPPKPVAWIEIGAGSDTEIATAVPGRVQAASRTVLSFEVGGTIASMSADIGDRVGRGNVIASLDPASYRLEVAGAQANLAESRARLNQARLDEERQEYLYSEGAASQARLENARAQLGSLGAIADANEAQLGVAREALSDTRLRAPYSGQIARRMVEPGTQVSPGQPVYELDGTQLEVTFSVPQRQLGRLSVGQTVTVVPSSGDGVTSSARITDIGSRASGPGAFEIVAALAAGSPELESGQVVEVRLPDRPAQTENGQATDRLLVPLTAIIPDGDDSGYVWRIAPRTQQLEKVPVRFGEASGNQLAVLSGLSSGDVIVSKGAAFLSEGQEISRLGVGPRLYAR
ncbi:MAG: efflux RND transporter periplasmic adaptor subunit [Parvularcula sp.]|jgi:RND family efflux transporter MFP subunit|nr:efflux RND transporter periplasmic adaptor subunit [Parvularcula sp.]